MTSDPSIELRVRRLENDTESIYELIADIRSVQQEHTQRFEAIDARLDGMDTRFDRIDARLDGMDTRFDRIDARLDGMDTRFDGIDTRLDGIESALAEVLRRLPEA